MWLQDSGGSTGELRAAFNMPAMGDIRKCMIALAPEDTVLTSACRHRFDNPEGIAGHSLGNLIISALFQMSGGFADASLRAASIQLKGRVLPSTENAMTLCAAYEDGGVARGKANIPKPGGRIRRVWLSPDRPAAAPGVIAAPHAADAIVLGPGSLYTSIIADETGIHRSLEPPDPKRCLRGSAG